MKKPKSKYRELKTIFLENEWEGFSASWKDWSRMPVLVRIVGHSGGARQCRARYRSSQ